MSLLIKSQRSLGHFLIHAIVHCYIPGFHSWILLLLHIQEGKFNIFGNKLPDECMKISRKQSKKTCITRVFSRNDALLCCFSYLTQRLPPAKGLINLTQLLPGRHMSNNMWKISFERVWWCSLSKMINVIAIKFLNGALRRRGRGINWGVTALKSIVLY